MHFGPDSVKSGAIHSVEYDNVTQNLEVIFKDGTPVRYMNVPEKVYWSLMEAPSVGAYFNHNIRDNYQMGG